MLFDYDKLWGKGEHWTGAVSDCFVGHLPRFTAAVVSSFPPTALHPSPRAAVAIKRKRQVLDTET